MSLFASAAAFPAEILSTAKSSEFFNQSSSHRTHWSLLGSVGGGYAGVTGDDYAKAPGGPQGILSAELALQTADWEFDGGLGWLYSQISGENKSQVPIEIRTRAGLIDLGTRYRVTERFQVGPQANLAFGTDTGFGPSIESARGALLLGLKGLYDLNSHYRAIPLRLWAQASSDLNLGSRRLYVGLVGLQIGLPFYGGKSSEGEDGALTMVLDSEKVFFRTNSAKIKPEVMSTLKDVGALLQEDREQDASIHISGHADIRGSYMYNFKLSRRRAESVNDAMMAGGADPDALAIKAYSFLQPLDDHRNLSAFAKNRRVELHFDNIKDPEPFRLKLKALELEQPQIREN